MWTAQLLSIFSLSMAMARRIHADCSLCIFRLVNSTLVCVGYGRFAMLRVHA